MSSGLPVNVLSPASGTCAAGEDSTRRAASLPTENGERLGEPGTRWF